MSPTPSESTPSREPVGALAPCCRCDYVFPGRDRHELCSPDRRSRVHRLGVRRRRPGRLGGGRPGAAEKACKKAVKKRVGGDVEVHVVSSEFSQANSTVIMDVKGKRWRCLSSNDGVVAELAQQQGGHEGARQPAANVGKEWDRGCSDAKDGSYDRSKHSDEYEEGWQDCKKQ
jgi:hypothetical protein